MAGTVVATTVGTKRASKVAIDGIAAGLAATVGTTGAKLATAAIGLQIGVVATAGMEQAVRATSLVTMPVAASGAMLGRMEAVTVDGAMVAVGAAARTGRADPTVGEPIGPTMATMVREVGAVGANEVARAARIGARQADGVETPVAGDGKTKLTTTRRRKSLWGSSLRPSSSTWSIAGFG